MRGAFRMAGPVAGRGVDEMEQDELSLYQKLASRVRLSKTSVPLYAISGSIHWSFALRKSCSNKSGDDSNVQSKCCCYQT